MPPLGRHSSSLSVLSMASTDTAVSDTNSFTSEVQTRRRPTPTQLDALQTTFDEKPYLTRGERIALAESISMDLKAVTAWFQNRRQAAKRASISKKNTSGEATSSLSRTTPSLDRIASLSEKRVNRSRYKSSTTSPISDAGSSLSGRTLTPPYSPPLGHKLSKHTSISCAHTPEPRRAAKDELWRLLDSSPVLPASSPVAEKARFIGLPAQARSLRSLEFACANARTTKSHELEDEDDMTDEESPRRRVVGQPLMPQSTIRKKGARKEKENTPQSEHEGMAAMDVEAAMVLIGLMSRN